MRTPRGRPARAKPSARHLVLSLGVSGATMRRDGEIDRLFATGRYTDVTASTVDSIEFDPRTEAHIGHVVAALAASGRLDDASALLARLDASTGARELAIARFFLGVASCRAGDFTRSRALFLENVRSSRR